MKEMKEMEKACGKQGGKESCTQCYGGKTRGKETTWKNSA